MAVSSSELALQSIRHDSAGVDDEEGALLLQSPARQQQQQPCHGPARRLIQTKGFSSYATLCRGSISRVWPTYLGSAMEFYELGAYLQAGAALQHNFFEQPGSTTSASTAALGVWVGHSCTFLIRPLGGLLFGWVGDKFGRRVSMLITLVGMSVATALIGAIPITPSAPYLLLLIKVLQGLFVSGEGASALVYSIERSHPETSCLAGTSLFVTAVYAGMLLATVVTLVVVSILTEAQYFSWGWRLPFLAALPMGGGFLLVRQHLPETEAYLLALSPPSVAFCTQAYEHAKAKRDLRDQQTGSGLLPRKNQHHQQEPQLQPQQQHHQPRHQQQEENLPLPINSPESSKMNSSSEQVQEQGGRWLPVVLGMLCVCTNPAGAYGGLLYFPMFLSHTAGLYSIKAATSLSVAGALVGMAAAPSCGALGDFLGAESLILWGAALIGALAWPLWALAVSGLGAAFLSICLWSAALAVQAGVYATFLADLFPTESRATGIGTSYNLAFALFGGLCPILETLVWGAATGGGETRTSRVANSTPALLLVAVSAANIAACLVLRRLRARGVLRRHLLVSSEPGAAEDAVIGPDAREMDEICGRPENNGEGDSSSSMHSSGILAS